MPVPRNVADDEEKKKPRAHHPLEFVPLACRRLACGDVRHRMSLRDGCTPSAPVWTVTTL